MLIGTYTFRYNKGCLRQQSFACFCSIVVTINNKLIIHSGTRCKCVLLNAWRCLVSNLCASYLSVHFVLYVDVPCRNMIMFGLLWSFYVLFYPMCVWIMTELLNNQTLKHYTSLLKYIKHFSPILIPKWTKSCGMAQMLSNLRSVEWKPGFNEID